MHIAKTLEILELMFVWSMFPFFNVGLALDGCTNPLRASAIVNRALTGMDIRSESGDRLKPTSLISWMSYDSATTIDLARLLQSLSMPLVSPGATASLLDDKSEFYTFFRTIPSDSVLVKGELFAFIDMIRR